MGVRVVPGSSAIRGGAFVAKGVICVPPMPSASAPTSAIQPHRLARSSVVRAGGQRVHVSAGAQIGGVIGHRRYSVIIED